MDEPIHRPYCLNCKKPSVEMVSLGDDRLANANTTRVCVNVQCPLYTNPALVRTWRPVVA